MILPLGLVVSGSLLLGALAIALAGLLARFRGRRPSPEPTATWPPADPPDPVWWGIGIVAALVLLGPVVAIGLVAGALGAARRRLHAAVAGGALIALSGLLDALGRPEPLEAPADLVAALGVGLLAGLVLGLPRRRTPDPDADGATA